MRECTRNTKMAGGQKVEEITVRMLREWQSGKHEDRHRSGDKTQPKEEEEKKTRSVGIPKESDIHDGVHRTNTRTEKRKAGMKRNERLRRRDWRYSVESR